MLKIGLGEWSLVGVSPFPWASILSLANFEAADKESLNIELGINGHHCPVRALSLASACYNHHSSISQTGLKVTEVIKSLSLWLRLYGTASIVVSLSPDDVTWSLTCYSLFSFLTSQLKSSLLGEAFPGFKQCQNPSPLSLWVSKLLPCFLHSNYFYAIISFALNSKFSVHFIFFNVYAFFIVFPGASTWPAQYDTFLQMGLQVVSPKKTSALVFPPIFLFWHHLTVIGAPAPPVASTTFPLPPFG